MVDFIWVKLRAYQTLDMICTTKPASACSLIINIYDRVIFLCKITDGLYGVPLQSVGPFRYIALRTGVQSVNPSLEMI